MLPSRLDSAPIRAALAAFVAEPSPDGLKALGAVVWSVAESEGGIATLDIRRGLLATGMAAGLDESDARASIARTIPGPDEYSPGDAWASPGQGGDATPEQQEWLRAVASRSPGQVDHRAMPGVGRAGYSGLIVSTTDAIPGYEVVRVLGLVTASAVRTRDFVSKIGSSVRDVVGGEHGTQTGLVEETCDLATARLVERARQLGANAVVGVRYVSSDIFGGSAEFTAYGTAEVVERLAESAK